MSFALEGSGHNRLALNAPVRITAGDLAEMDEVRSEGSYLSQSDLRVHFGLGGHSPIDKVEIFWPLGEKETLSNLAADRYYTVREGEGVVAAKEPAKSVIREQ